MTETTERAAAIQALLERPFELDDQRRHILTCEGDPDRHVRYRELEKWAATYRRAERLGELR